MSNISSINFNSSMQTLEKPTLTLSLFSISSIWFLIVSILSSIPYIYLYIYYILTGGKNEFNIYNSNNIKL